jgi:hypothetical protein
MPLSPILKKSKNTTLISLIHAPKLKSPRIKKGDISVKSAAAKNTINHHLILFRSEVKRKKCPSTMMNIPMVPRCG